MNPGTAKSRNDCRESRQARVALETLLCLGRMTVIQQAIALRDAAQASSHAPEPEWIEGDVSIQPDQDGAR